MKQHLKHLLAQAVDELCRQGVLQQGAQVQAQVQERPIHIERTRNPRHGDFASNLAMVLAKPVGGNPRALAEQLVAALPASGLLEKTEIAGAGFINFFLSPAACRAVIDDIRQAGEQYGFGSVGAGRTVLVEFVSANPTGPLHVGLASLRRISRLMVLLLTPIIAAMVCCEYPSFKPLEIWYRCSLVRCV